MSYPVQDEIMTCDPVLEWIDDFFLRPDPFAFKDTDFREIVKALSTNFDVDPNGIFCIGSGAVGLSFSPRNVDNGKLKKFNNESDIDLAIISEVYFETAWRDLRKAAQPSLEEIDPNIKENLLWQKKRFFDGAILTNKLLASLSFGANWISSEVRISESVAVALGREVDVNFWVYRDYWSLRNYVSSGLMQCRKFLV